MHSFSRSLVTCRSRLVSLSGRRRNGAAFALGVLATLALPPFFCFPLLIPAFAGLFWLADAAPTKKRAFWDGWWWGFGHFISGLYWICIALLTDAAKFGWLIPFALIGLNGVIALYVAAACWAYHCLTLRGEAGDMRKTLRHVMLFAAVWTLVEYARGHWFTGFPWNLTGYSWAYFDSVAQAASVIGVYGLGFVTVLAALAPVFLLSGKKSGTVSLLCVWGGFALMAASGAWRLQAADERPYAERFAPGVHLRLVQANIAQPHKWDVRLQMQALRRHLELSRQDGWDKATHVIWPETAVPYALNISPSLISIIYDAAPYKGALLTGALHAQEGAEDAPLWNSLAVLPQQEGKITYYDKHHLVPFGEFVPFRAVLPVEKITPGARDFSRGPGPRTLEVPNAPKVSPLICYEAIFPSQVVDQLHRPDWLLNVTNDAWFGHSTGPYQHYYMAKMRAVEEGLPLVRAANTGISAVVDAYGRELKRLPLGVQGVLDERLPAPAKTTIYGGGGYRYLLLLMLIVSGFTLFYEFKGNFKK